MSLIPYAGFDPDEDDIEDLMPWRYRRDWQYVPIDSARVRQLRAQGMRWTDVGKHLAREVNRPIPYRADSVYTAARKGSEPCHDCQST